MSPEAQTTFQKYRYENLLPRAIKEQKQNDKIRRVCGWMLVAFVIYVVLFWIVAIYLERHGIKVLDTGWDFAAFLPGGLLGSLGILGMIAYEGNSIMEIIQVDDTYLPKNP